MKPSASPAFVVACVKWGGQYGAYYVNTLHDMVRRNLPGDYEFQCFTDDPIGLDQAILYRPLPGSLTGWWNKLYLFKEGVFSPDRRVLYFDLDTLILGNIEPLTRYTGEFALLEDFYRPGGYGSGVMLWRAGACCSIWSGYEKAGRPLPVGGDQAWIESAFPGADRLQACFPGMFASFKVDCHPLPPPQTRVLCFHGEPKQDNCELEWVREVWKAGGVYPPVFANDAAAKPCRRVEEVAAHSRQAIIIGGGPSLDECSAELMSDMALSHTVFAVNGAPLWLSSHGLRFDAQVVGNIQEERTAPAPQKDIHRYYLPGCLQPFRETSQSNLSTGLYAILLAHRLGFRRFHLYGFDSCYIQGAHHAYDWPEEERNRRFTAELHGRRFQASMWMLKQADDFIALADRLLKEGCSFSIHGDGMLHFLAGKAQTQD